MKCLNFLFLVHQIYCTSSTVCQLVIPVFPKVTCKHRHRSGCGEQGHVTLLYVKMLLNFLTFLTISEELLFMLLLFSCNIYFYFKDTFYSQIYINKINSKISV